MCLAVPGRILKCDADDALVDLQGNRVRISRVLTPDTRPGDWVLVHAGFSIATVDEAEALETWDYLRQAYGPDFATELEIESEDTGNSEASLTKGLSP